MYMFCVRQAVHKFIYCVATPATALSSTTRVKSFIYRNYRLLTNISIIGLRETRKGK